MKKHHKTFLHSTLLVLLAGSVLVGCGSGSTTSTTSTPDTGSNWTVLGESGFSGSSADVARISVTTSGTPYVVYSSKSGEKFPGSVQKFDGTSWVQVGTNFGTNVANANIAVFGTTPYVAYQDLDNNGSLAVKMFDGTNWVAVGNPSEADTTVGQATSINISVDSKGTPYVAYEWYPIGSQNIWDMAGHPEVITWSGSSWSKVGTTNLQNEAAAYIAMKIAPDDVISVAYSNIGNNSGALYVKRYNTIHPTGWKIIGLNSQQSPYIGINVASQGGLMAIYGDTVNGGGAMDITLAGSMITPRANFANDNIGNTPSTVLSEDGTAYVAFLGPKNNGVLKSYNLDDNKWSVVASSGTAISNPQIAADQNDNIYILYSEPQLQGKLTVVKYNTLANTN